MVELGHRERPRGTLPRPEDDARGQRASTTSRRLEASTSETREPPFRSPVVVDRDQDAVGLQALLGNIVFLAYAAPTGIQAGTQTLVGNFLGAQAPAKAKKAAQVGTLLGVATMAAQAAVLFVFRSAWASLFRSEPDVGRQVAALLKFVVVFNVGDGIQLVLSGVITGAGKQRITTPILFVSYWILGLPLGALAAFKFRKGLLGLWAGMTLAVWLHVAAYGVICFARFTWTIDWPAAAAKAAERLEADAAAPDAAINHSESDLECKRDDSDDDSEQRLRVGAVDDRRRPGELETAPASRDPG